MLRGKRRREQITMTRRYVVPLLALAACLTSSEGVLLGEDVLEDPHVMSFHRPEDLVNFGKEAGAMLAEKWTALQEDLGVELDEDMSHIVKQCSLRKFPARLCADRMIKFEKEVLKTDMGHSAMTSMVDAIKASRHIATLGGIGDGDASSTAHEACFVGALGAPTTAAHFQALPAPGSEEKVQINGLEEFGGAQLMEEALSNSAALQLFDEIESGAIALAGALPLSQMQSNWTKWAAAHEIKERKHKFTFVNERNHQDWALATWAADSQVETPRANTNATAFLEFENWFLENGGQLQFAKIDAQNHNLLRTTEEVAQEDVLLRVPMKLVLAQPTLRNVMSEKRERLHKILSEDFKYDQEWGLAFFLAHEYGRGEESPWWPFINVLRMTVLKASVLDDIRDSFATRLLQDLDDTVALMLRHLDKTKDCGHDRGVLCRSLGSAYNLRWALAIVRRYAVLVQKRTTGKPFLALVPYVHLMAHREGQSGEMTMELNNCLEFSRAQYAAGVPIFVDRGNFSDAEQLVRFARVQEEENSFNEVRMLLPGVKRPYEPLLWFPEMKRSDEWRRMLRLPPRQSTLWQGAHRMMLFGDGTDEEEEETFKSIRSEEEKKLIRLALEVGAASTEQEAALVIRGASNDEYDELPQQQLYTALEPEEENDDIWHGRAALALGFFQLQDAIASGSKDESARKVVNMTKEFYMDGRVPLRGMDPVDKVMKRRLLLLQDCGNSTTHVLQSEDISDNLLCSLRIHLINETDADVLCPPGKSPFADMHCCKDEEPMWNFSPDKCKGESNSIFNATLPVSRENEERVLHVLMDGVKLLYALLPGGDSSADARLLETLLASGQETASTSALRYRQREKALLERTVSRIEERLERLDDTFFQVDDVRKVREAEKADYERRRHRAELLRNTSHLPPVVSNVSVDLDGQKLFVVVREGQAIDAIVKNFSTTHRIPPNGAAQLSEELKAQAKREAPVDFTLPVLDGVGVRHMLLVKEGDNVTEVVEDFCITHNISNFYDDDHSAREFAKRVHDSAWHKHNATQGRQVLLDVPVNLVDGRLVQLRVREGEQHDLPNLVRDFIDAYAIDGNMLETLLDVLDNRLPTALLYQPVTVADRTFNLRITSSTPKDIEDTIMAFASLHDIDKEYVPQLRQRVLSKLHPGVLAAPPRSLLEVQE